MSNREEKPESSGKTRLPLKIGLIVDSRFSNKYVFELCEWAQRQENLVISHLIIQHDERPKQNFLKKAINRLRRESFLQFLEWVTFELIIGAEKVLLKSNPRHRDHLSSKNLAQVVRDLITVSPIISKNQRVYRYSGDDIAKVESLDLDVLIRCGSGILRGQILTATRFGILSFHHANNRINRGGPAGFWEAYHREPSTGFILQQLTEELDAGNVLIRGEFPTRFYFLLNQAFLYKKSYIYLMNMLSQLAVTRTLPQVERALPYYNQLFKPPRLRAQVIYTAKLIRRVVVKFFRTHVSTRQIRWQVAFSRSNWRDLAMWRAFKVPNPPGRFLADPFVVKMGERDFCFVEDYSFKEGKACISVLELKQKDAVMVGEAIKEPFHLSFPYLFHFGGDLYMCPETHENKDIRVYKCVEFPMKWELEKVLMTNISAGDTMIFEREGLWWLFTNIDPSDIGDHCSELFIFSSETPLSGEWVPHPQNPVIINSNRARNGGLLSDDGSLYRIAQRQGFEVYGAGFSINKIITLTLDKYAEVELCSVEPNFFQKAISTHHLDSIEGLTVFDCAEYARVGSN